MPEKAECAANRTAAEQDSKEQSATALTQEQSAMAAPPEILTWEIGSHHLFPSDAPVTDSSRSLQNLERGFTPADTLGLYSTPFILIK